MTGTRNRVRLVLVAAALAFSLTEASGVAGEPGALRVKPPVWDVTGPAEGESSREAIDLAAQRLSAAAERLGDPAAREGLERQMGNLARTAEVLRIMRETSDPAKRARRVAAASARYQVAWLERASEVSALPAVSARPLGSRPSLGARHLLQRVGVVPTPEQAGRLERLDELAPAAGAAVGRVFAAFEGFYGVAAAEYGSPSSSVAPIPGSAVGVATIAARQALLDASLDLMRALGQRSSVSACDPILVLPALAIDLDGCDSTYEEPVMLSIDAGGDDLYRNNAGGNSVTPAAALIDLAGSDRYNGYRSGGNGSGSLGAGFLLDARGNDVYTPGQPAPGHGYLPGSANGGGGALGHGFLVDLEGDDVYSHKAEQGAVNGGATSSLGPGTGLLLDLVGKDTYRVDQFSVYSRRARGNGGSGPNGNGSLIDLDGEDVYEVNGHDGGNGGGSYDAWNWDEQLPPRGFLLDAGSGNDVYAGAGIGSNGGASGRLTAYLAVLVGYYEHPSPVPHPTAFLFDEAGDDVYTASGGHGVNGGASLNATGALIDGAGDDRYVAQPGWSNGGAETGTGLLLDYQGADRYEEGETVLLDCTVIPKGVAGAQIDHASPAC